MRVPFQACLARYHHKDHTEHRKRTARHRLWLASHSPESTKVSEALPAGVPRMGMISSSGSSGIEVFLYCHPAGIRGIQQKKKNDEEKMRRGKQLQ